jgi:hypothetical protein
MRGKEPKNLRNRGVSSKKSSRKKDVNPPSRSAATKLSPEVIAEIYNTYVDSDNTTRMWKLISTNNIEEISDWLE